MRRRHRRDAVTSRLRLRGYDYSAPGMYAITICTEQRLCLFGDVRDDVMEVSAAGQVVESWWDSIPCRFPGATMDERIVMPNHLHGILMIGVDENLNEDDRLPNLSAVIQWYKGMTTNDYMRGVRTLGWRRFPGRLWQDGFHEHIIRHDAALERWRAYIGANPSQWPRDDENPTVMGL